MKKLTAILLILAMTAITLASCGGSADSGWTGDPFAALKAVTDQLDVKDLPEGGTLYDSNVTDEEAEGYLDDFTKAEVFKDNAGNIDFSPVAAYGIYVPESKKATNIGILKAKSAADVKAVETLVRNRIAAVQTKFTSYIPEEDSIAKKSLVKVNGLYVYYVIAQNTNKIGDMIKAEMDKTTTAAQ